MAQSMFERVGGTEGVTELFTRFYSKVLTNPVASPVFNGFDMAEIKRLQIELWSNALGSGTPYTGRSMFDSHRGLGITNEQFDVVATALSETMKEMNFPDDIYQVAMTTASAMRGDIVEKKTMFERVGGTAGVTELFTRFYGKVLNNPVASPVFKGFDMNEIKRLQIELWSNALGSGTPYTGRSMLDSHKGLGITNEQFDVVATSLSEVLKEMNFPDDIYEVAMKTASSMRGDIVEVKTMFERVGGTAGVTELFTRFYAKVLNDPVASPVFKGFDMSEIKRLQIELWSNALGSGTPYTGRSMLDSHKGLAITDDQFNVVANSLSEVMREMNFPEDIYNVAMTTASAMRSDIVGH